MLVMPSTKQMASRMLDFPDPLRPVIELKLSSLYIAHKSDCHGTIGRFIYSPSGDHRPDGIRLEALQDCQPFLLIYEIRFAYVNNDLNDPHVAVVNR